MKAIMISISPQWTAKILNGVKKEEIKKGIAIGEAINKLIEEQGVAPMLIYCTKSKPFLFKDLYAEKSGSGQLYYVDDEEHDNWSQKLNDKVVARFNATAEEIEWEYESSAPALSKYATRHLYEWDLCVESRLPGKEMIKYLGEEDKGTAIHIDDLKIFDEPKEVSEFYHRFTQKRCERPFSNNNIEIDSETHGLRQPTKSGYEYVYPLTRAPQNGWCYVYVEE